MKSKEVIEITQEEALKAVKSKGSIIHCFLGRFGADWKNKSVIDLIKKSKRIAWAYDMFNHNLAVISEGKLYRFDLEYKKINQ